MTPDDLILSGRAIARTVAARVFADYRRRGFAIEFDDVHSGALLGLVHAARSFDPEKGAAFTTWAWPYARRYAVMAANTDAGLTAGRGDGGHVAHLDDVEDDERSREPADDATDGDLFAARIAVREAVAALPEREREVVVLTYWRDLGPTAVGSRVGLSKSGARAALARAHEALRETLAGAA